MPQLLSQILLQVLLILLNAFFAATEIAVISLNGAKLKSKAENGDKKAAKMLRMVEEPTGFLSTIQIGITLAGFLGSAFAADNFSDSLVNWLTVTCGVTVIPIAVLDVISVIVITLILSYFTLVLGELVPKRIAMRHPEALARAVSGIISFLSVALRPIIWLLTKSTNAVLRIFGVSPQDTGETVSEEDIVTMLEAGGEDGTIKPEEIEYIKNVFELNDLTVSEIMVPRNQMTHIFESDSQDEVMKVIAAAGYSRIPVCHGDIDHIIGVLRVRDYLLGCQSDQKFMLQQAIIPAQYVPESLRVDAAFRKMQKNHIQMAIVLDEYGGTSGLVTLEDMLEELVGEIWDEQESVREPIQKTAEGTYVVLGSTRLEELERFLRIEIDSEANTVSGWIMERLGRIPSVGDRIFEKNMSVIVSKTRNRVVDQIEIKAEEEEEKDKK